MSMFLTEDVRMVQKAARTFAEQEILPVAAQLDQDHEFPADIVKKLGQLGFLGIMVPEQYGGVGMSTVEMAVIMEEISKASAAVGLTIQVSTCLATEGLLKHATEEQKQKYLVPLAKGEYLASFALTEPDAGSDAAAVRTSATDAGDHWVLNGSKMFITNATRAGITVLIASTDRSQGPRGLSAFIVEAGTPGFSSRLIERKLGMHASATGELVFQDCRIPKANLLGKPGDGFKIAMQALDLGRVGIAAQAVGIAQAAMDASVKYAKERVQFGAPIAKLQAIQWMIAEMATDTEAARLLTHKAASLRDQGARYSMEAAQAKLFAAEAAMRHTTKAIQIHGGYGYTAEYPVERFFRDAKVTEIYEGTSEIQKLVIAGSLLR